LQQCIALAALRMHTSKERKKNYKKEMFRYSDQFIEIAVLTPPRHGVFSVIMMKPLNTYSSSANLLDLYGQSSK
jgi:hypothetical protein